MEFYIFLEGQINHCAKFCISTSSFDDPIQIIVDNFTADIRKTLNDKFDPSGYGLYIDDHSNLTSIKPPQLIKDLTASISTLEGKEFDLILSLVEPQPTHQIFQETDDSSVVIQRLAFDDAVQQAKIALDNRDFKTANINIHKARTLNPNDPTPLHLHIRLCMKLHHFKLAIEDAANAVRLFPTDKTSLILSARAHQRAGLHEEAIELYKRVFLYSPHNTAEYDEINIGISRSLLALDCADQALTLMKPIVTSNPLNLKATVLLGTILAKQGRLAEGLHVVMQNFSVEPDHKASRKFIGHHIFNERQAELLRAELGDGNNNPYILFYVATILNEYGSCGVAQYFMAHALKLRPFDPSIAVGCLKNTICICINPSEVLEIANTFLPNIGKRTDSFKVLVKDFDLNHIHSNIDQKPSPDDIKPQPCVPTPQGSKDALFKIEQYDTIWFMILLEVFLYTHGYITASAHVCQNIQHIVKQFNFSKTVICKEIRQHLYMASIIPTLPRSIPRVDHSIFLIGDDHCLTLAWRIINYKGKPHLIIPIIVDDLQPNQLSSTEMTVNRTSFWSSMRLVPPNSLIIFFIGTLDVSTVDQVTEKGEVQTIEKILTPQIESCLKICQKLIIDKNCTIWLHPIHHIIGQSVKTIYDFNDRLARVVWFYSRDHPNIRMIDIFDKLTVTDKKTNELQFNKDYFIDPTRLSPTYIPIVEDSMNNESNLLEKHLPAPIKDGAHSDIDELIYQIEGQYGLNWNSNSPSMQEIQPNNSPDPLL